MKRILPFILLLLAPVVMGVDGGGPTQYLFNYSGAPDVNASGTPTMWIDFSQDPSGATITSSDGGFVFTKNQTPSRVEDYTFPDGISGAHGYAHSFDGANDYYYRASDGSFNPAGSFSVQCVVTNTDGTALDHIIGKWNTTGNQRGWRIYTNIANVIFAVSDDGTSAGGHYSTLTRASGCAQNRPMFVTATYDPTPGDGSCEARLYVDNLATATSSAFDGPVHPSTANFTIAADGAAGGDWPGLFHHCSYHDGVVLTEAQHDAAFARWSGFENMAGDKIPTMASSSPPSVIIDDGSNVQPFITTPAANSGLASLWGMNCSRQVDNYCYRSSFKSWAGAGDVTGWTETVGGSGTILEENTNVAHGYESVKLTTTGAGDDVEIVSQCINFDESQNHNFSIWHKKASGTADLYVTVKGYSDNACTLNEVAELSLTPGDVASTWGHTDAKISTGALAGTTDYVTVTIGQADIAGVVYVDAVSLNKQTLHSHNYCGCDTDALCSCDDMIPAIITPQAITVGNWTVGGKGKSSAAMSESAEARYGFNIEGTAGNNNRVMVFVSGGNFSCRIYDSSGVAHTSSVAGAVAADTEFTWKVSHRQSDGAVLCELDGVADATPATGADMDGVGALTYFGGSSDTDGRNSFVYDVYFVDRIVP